MKPVPAPDLAKKALPEAFVKLSNRWATFDVDPDLHDRLKEIFRYMKPGSEFAPSYREGEWDGYTHMFSRGRVATGLFLEFRDKVEKKFALTVEDARIFPRFRPVVDPAERPFQTRAIEAMMRASNSGGIVISATGTGKTWLAAGYFRRLVGCGLFVVDELGLLEQTRREIERALGEEIGIVGKGEFSSKRITVATAQTLERHRDAPAFKKWFVKIDAMLIDEFHVMLGKRNFDVVASIKPKACFGLTATLKVMQEHVRVPMLALCGPEIFRYEIKTAVEEGYLSEGTVICVAFLDPLRGTAPGYWGEPVKGKRPFIPPGSPQADYRWHVCLNAARNDCIEALIREAVARNRRVIALTERKTHLRALSHRLNDVEHAALSGDSAVAKRTDATTRMDDGKLSLILASKVFAKGVDVKSADLILDATGLPSENNAQQRYGRGMRLWEGKQLVHVDIADKKSPFSRAADSRRKALRETGSEMIDVRWNGDARAIFELLG